MVYDYKIAQDALSVQDKNRILAVYLNCDNSALNGIVDWQAASTAFGSASVESFKKMIGLKKIQAKDTGDGATPGPAKTPGGRKRKTKGDGDDEAETPKKRGGVGSKKKKGAEPAKTGKSTPVQSRVCCM
ncbi:hypothetical protein LTR62_000360 [Meristemomyces frigidus]|uniref:Uncharacterized protein n=1 Tax=Meristemomyces frigidus TaxID=1508187 RepID=A0AAN7TGJ8_9PEZI|nr:hypothetical protein LTR62_000360 [Meristemomyces frigidus]